MRPDMPQVIIERPRAHSWPNRAKGRLKARKLEDLPQREPMPGSVVRSKQQTDVLGPLIGFLRKSCGRPWDKVWSEICKQAHGSEMAKSHFRDHVLREVSTNINDKYRRHFLFFVDDNGILRASKPYRYRGPKKEQVVWANPTTQCKRINGLWHFVQVAPFFENYTMTTMTIGNRTWPVQKLVPVYDLFKGWIKHVYQLRQLALRNGGRYRAVKAWQMNKRDIRKFIPRRAGALPEIVR